MKNFHHSRDRRILIFFMFFLLLSSYTYIVFECYSTIAGLSAGKGLVDLGGNPAGHDFIVFWGASKIARCGDPSSIYSIPKFNAILQSFAGTRIRHYAWNYPPTFLLILVPLSFFPYMPALIIWTAGPLLVLLRQIRLIFSDPTAPWLFLCFPGIVYNLVAGQNGSFTAVFLCGGLLLLVRSPFMAGLLLGVVSYKPHLFALLPIALLSGRNWKALAGLTVGVTVLTLASLVVFGPRLWQSFFENIPFAATHWQYKDLLIKMPTAFSLAQLSGNNDFLSAIFQIIVTLTTIYIVVWTWSQDVNLAFKGSILSLCIALSSPYLFCYDLAVISLPFAWMGWMAYTSKDSEMLLILVMCWVGLFFSIFFPYGVNPTPIILGILLAYIVYRMRAYEATLPQEGPSW